MTAEALSTGRAYLTECDPGMRLLSRASIEQLNRARAAGIPVGVVAKELGVSRRTAYRWLGASFVESEIGGFRATFVVKPGHYGPIQITRWQAAA